jgi:hypothetical protein
MSNGVAGGGGCRPAPIGDDSTACGVLYAKHSTCPENALRAGVASFRTSSGSDQQRSLMADIRRVPALPQVERQLL